MMTDSCMNHWYEQDTKTYGINLAKYTVEDLVAVNTTTLVKFINKKAAKTFRMIPSDWSAQLALKIATPENRLRIGKQSHPEAMEGLDGSCNGAGTWYRSCWYFYEFDREFWAKWVIMGKMIYSKNSTKWLGFDVADILTISSSCEVFVARQTFIQCLAQGRRNMWAYIVWMTRGTGHYYIMSHFHRLLICGLRLNLHQKNSICDVHILSSNSYQIDLKG